MTLFEFADGKIARMTECADAFRYAALRIRPNGAEFRSFLRALKHLSPFG